MKKVAWLLALAGGLLTTGLAVASKSSSAGQLEVHDKAGLFTADGIAKAKEKFRDTAFKAPTHFAVVTVGEADVPAARKADYDTAKKDKNAAGQFFREWTKEMALSHGKPDVVALIFSQGDQFFVDVITDRETDVKRHFTDKDAGEVSKLFQTGMRDAKARTGDDAKTIRNATLMAATENVIAQLKDTTVSTGKTSSSTTGEKAKSTGMGIGGWICIGLCVLLGVWVVIALFRALTGGGGGGGPGGGGGYGGGGGGFMTSFLGGMFGAAAGMWMYNSFMGGSSAMAADGSAAGGAADTGDTTGDTGAGDYDGGAGAGGGDFGDTGGGDYGGGDFGGGGGDFGGGDW